MSVERGIDHYPAPVELEQRIAPVRLALLEEVTLEDVTAAPEATPAHPQAQQFIATLLARPAESLASLTQQQADTFVDEVLSGYVQYAERGSPRQRKAEIVLYAAGLASSEIARRFGMSSAMIVNSRRNVIGSLVKKFTLEQLGEYFDKSMKGEKVRPLQLAPVSSVRRHRQTRDERDTAVEAIEDQAPEYGAADEEAYAGLDPVRLYFNQIGKVALLNAAQEVELSKQIEAGLYAEHQLEAAKQDQCVLERVAKRHAEVYDVTNEAGEVSGIDFEQVAADLRAVAREGQAAKHAMLEANLRLAASLAKRYQGKGLDLLDLIQEGNLGLMHAIEKFDYTQGFKFSTYATWWIRQTIVRGIADQSRTIRVPVHATEELSKMIRVERNLLQEHNREPTDEELAAGLKVTRERVRELKGWARVPVSLDTPVGDGDAALGDFIEDDGARQPLKTAAPGMMRADIAAVLRTLPALEEQVIIMRYGLTDGTPKTLEEVEKCLGVTQKRIRQIEKCTVAKLRDGAYAEKLRSYLK